jgi:hypothetical protein
MEVANFNGNARRRKWTVNSALFGLRMILAVSAIIFVVSTINIYSYSLFQVQMQSLASLSPKTLTWTPGKKKVYQPSFANGRKLGKGDTAANDNFPLPFQSIMDRAMKFDSFCHTVSNPIRINSTSQEEEADLPGFGIIDALNSYEDTAYGYQCSMPPETECTEQQFSIIIMGYGPDRLLLLRKEMKHMLSNQHFRRNEKAVFGIIRMFS